ncbi:MAG: xylose isomerase [Clostridiales bacterium]|jgi:xylose isomerase|nr:xylose isomerase [Clostridiales bacterium]MDK2933237.1 xylose isomerase [Clostridiales bacterium]
MERKYSIITGFMGRVKDRFIDYHPPREMEEMVAMAAKVKGCSGLEVVYPQNFVDPVKTKKLLQDYNLGVSTVNLNIKGEEKWRFGTFSSPNPETRKEAVKYLKTAMDCAAELGCNMVTMALLNDGADYPFELDYIRAFNHTLDGIREAAEYRSDVKISLEYKASEPRVHCLLNNAGKMAYFCNLVGKDNVGVTLDVGHALQCLEIPADSAAFLGATGKLFYVHINDNFRNWDWDMVPGTINLWDYVEFIMYLKKVNYHGWITADVFPQRHDPIRIMEKTFEWMDRLFDMADSMDEKVLFEMMNNKDAFAVLDYVRSFIKF